MPARAQYEKRTHPNLQKMTRHRNVRANKQNNTLKTWLKPGKDDLCVREFKIFKSGGRPGIAVLERVWKTILTHYDVQLHRGYIICMRAGMKMKDDGRIYTTSEE